MSPADATHSRRNVQAAEAAASVACPIAASYAPAVYSPTSQLDATVHFQQPTFLNSAGASLQLQPQPSPLPPFYLYLLRGWQLDAPDAPPPRVAEPVLHGAAASSQLQPQASPLPPFYIHRLAEWQATYTPLDVPSVRVAGPVRQKRDRPAQAVTPVVSRPPRAERRPWGLRNPEAYANMTMINTRPASSSQPRARKNKNRVMSAVEASASMLAPVSSAMGLPDFVVPIPHMYGASFPQGQTIGLFTPPTTPSNAQAAAQYYPFDCASNEPASTDTAEMRSRESLPLIPSWSNMAEGHTPLFENMSISTDAGLYNMAMSPLTPASLAFSHWAQGDIHSHPTASSIPQASVPGSAYQLISPALSPASENERISDRNSATFDFHFSPPASEVASAQAYQDLAALADAATNSSAVSEDHSAIFSPEELAELQGLEHVFAGVNA